MHKSAIFSLLKPRNNKWKIILFPPAPHLPAHISMLLVASKRKSGLDSIYSFGLNNKKSLAHINPEIKWLLTQDNLSKSVSSYRNKGLELRKTIFLKRYYEGKMRISQLYKNS